MLMTDNITDREFLEEMEKVAKLQEDHAEFYDLAEKYGFSTPWDV